MRRQRIINKKIKKLVDKRCAICGENDYDLLHVHRINFLGKNNQYTRGNSLTLCVVCHTKVHREKINILGKYFTSKGVYIINFMDENGDEQIREV